MFGLQRSLRWKKKLTEEKGTYSHVSGGPTQGMSAPAATWTNAYGIQTRMQVINPSPGAVYSGLSNAVMTIARVEGIRSLWRGVASVIVGAGTDSRLV